jgi:hypothetical protein
MEDGGTEASEGRGAVSGPGMVRLVGSGWLAGFGERQVFVKSWLDGFSGRHGRQGRSNARAEFPSGAQWREGRSWRTIDLVIFGLFGPFLVFWSFFGGVQAGATSGQRGRS